MFPRYGGQEGVGGGQAQVGREGQGGGSTRCSFWRTPGDCSAPVAAKLFSQTQLEISQVVQGSSTQIVFMRNGSFVGMLENRNPDNILGVDMFAVQTGVTPQPGAIKELTLRTDTSGINII